MRRERETNDQITSTPGQDPNCITKAGPRDHRVTPDPNPDDRTVELEPGQFLITGKLAILSVFAVIGGVFGFVFAACGTLRGMIIPTLFAIRLNLDGAAGTALEKTVEALVEGGLIGLALTPVLALERREPLGKPHVTLRGYPRRLLRMLLPLTLGGALTLAATEWLNELTFWATGVVFTPKQRMLPMAAVGAILGAGIGLLVVRFPALVRFLPFRRRFPFQ